MSVSPSCFPRISWVNYVENPIRLRRRQNTLPNTEEPISPLGFVRREFTNIFLMAFLEELLK